MQRLVEYALSNALAATILAIIVSGICLVVRQPAVRNALWALVLLRLLCPPIWTIDLNLQLTEPAVTTTTTMIDAPPEAPPSTVEIDWQAWELYLLDYSGEERAPTVVEPTADTVPATSSSSETRPIPWIAIGGAVMLAGSVVWFVWGIICAIRFQRCLKWATPASPVIQQQSDAIARSLGLSWGPPVVLVPGRTWPALWSPSPLGRHARILLPTALTSHLSGEERAAVLAHELAHLRRGDPWMRWLELLVSALYWWFPLVWWFRRELRASEEVCCDLWVVSALNGRRQYASALVETAAYLGDGAVTSPALASGAGPIRNLQRRVTVIMSTTWSARLTRAGLAAILGIGVAGLSFGPALAQPKEGPEPRRPKEGGERRPEAERPKDGERRPEGERPKDGERRPEGERPKDGERRPVERPRDGERRPEAERPKDGERRPEGERPRDGDRRPVERPRDGERRPEGDRPMPKGSEREINEAREQAEKARREATEAVRRAVDAERRLAELEGRPFRGPATGFGPGGSFGPGGPGGGFPGGPGGRGEPGRGAGVGGPGGPPTGPGGAGGPGGVPAMPGGPDVRGLQQQIEELRRALEEMRREMRRGEPGRPREERK